MLSSYLNKELEMHPNRKLREVIKENMTPLNTLLADGIAYEHGKGINNRIDEVCRSMFRSLGRDFKFLEVVRCTPEETYRARAFASHSTSAMAIDLSRTDAYTVKLCSEYMGERIRDIYVHVPIIRRFGEMIINNTIYYVIPVLAGMPFSVEENKVFIGLQRHPMVMSKSNYSMVRDGTRHSADMVRSSLYNKDCTTVTNKLFTRPQYTSLQHILFAKYGCTEAFKRLFNVEVKVVDTKDPVEYDKENQSLYTSIGQRPLYSDRSKTSDWRASTLGLVIDKEQCTEEVESMVAGFFYTVDLFTDNYLEPEWADEPDVWKVTLGHILFNKEQSEGIVLKKMDAHIDSLDHYLDITKADELARQGIIVKDFYEFCARMLSYVPLLLRERSVTSMYGKQFTVLSYLLYNLVYDLNTLSYSIAKERRDKPDQQLTLRKVNGIFQSIKPHVIIKPLTSKEHPEVITTSLPNDMPPVKITNQVIPQAKAKIKGGAGGGSDATKDKSILFDASIAELGSCMYVTKGEGSGRNKLNLQVQCTPEGVPIPRPEYQRMIQLINKLIGRKVYPPMPEIDDDVLVKLYS